MVGDAGQNHNAMAASTMLNDNKDIHTSLADKLLSSVCVQNEYRISGKVKLKISANVKKTFNRSEKTTFERKKYDTSVIENETVLADERRAIVRVEDTTNIFSLRSSE